MPRPLVLVSALGLLVAGLSLADEVMEFDPAQYADVAARLLERGDWLHLEDLNGPFINKPPLMIWAQAAAMAVLGPTSVAARLPALFFAVLAVLGTYLVGRTLKDARLGAVAAAFLACSVAVHHAVADPKVDLALMAMTTWAVFAFLSQRILAGWLLTALAVLAKGPIGVVLVTFALVPELVRETPSPPPGARAGVLVRNVVAVALFAAVVVPFYAAQGPDAAFYLLWTQSFARVFGGSDFHDSTTPLYFLHTGSWALLPMTPLVIASLVRGFVKLRRERRLPADRRRVPVWWFALPFLVISASSYKLPQYVYWLAPPAALLAAEEVLRLSDTGLVRWRRVYAGLAIGAGVLGGFVLAVAFPPAGLQWLLAGGLILPLIAWAATRGQEAWLRVSALAATSGLGFLFLYTSWIHPSLLEFQPWREVAAQARELPPSEPLVLVEVAPSNALSFYARRRLVPATAEEIAARRPRVFVVSDAALAALPGARSLIRLPTYPVSIPRGPFLRASTREAQVKWVHVASFDR